MRLAELIGKRVGILGFGHEGRAALALMGRHCPDTDVTVISERPIAEAPNGVPMWIGPLADAPLGDFDVLLKSPGISLYRAALEGARSGGVRLTSGSQLWFAEPKRAPVVAITGSKGKSTTSALVAFLLQQAGLHCPLAGNIGVPLAALWPGDETGREVDAYVVELSSYQTADFEGRPDVAVLTNLFPEHLDWHGSESRYYLDKLKIFERNPPVCLVNGGDARSLERTEGLQRELFNHPSGWQVATDCVRYKGERVAGLPAWQVTGAHNRVNLSAALAVLHALGVDSEPGLTRLEAFRGLPHRLQVVGDADGVRLIDDSIATAPQATVAALRSFPDERLAVIVGGQDRGVDWQPLVDQLRDQPVRRILTVGECGERIAALICSVLPGQSVESCGELQRAVESGLLALNGQGVLLLSPGAPSYDQFEDYVQRGEAFRELALRAR